MSIDKSLIIGWCARGTVLLLSFVNTRLLIDCMGTDGFAAYSIVISLTPWLVLLNLGVPVTIQNAISRLRGNGADYRLVRNQAYGTMIFLALLLAPAAIAVGWAAQNFLLVNYPFVTTNAVISAVSLVYLSGVCQLLTQVMYAEHETFWPNIYPVLPALWTTCVLVVAQQYSIRNFNLLLVVLAFSNILMPIHAARTLNVFKQVDFSFKTAIRQISAAKDQLIFAILSTVTLSVDYLVMSRTLKAQDIVNYNVTSRLFMVVLVVFGVVLATNWTPIADLMHASNKNDARHKVEQVLKQGLIIGFSVGLMLFVGINPIASALTGGATGEIPIDLCVAFLVYILVRIWTDTYAVALQGYGMVSQINKFIPFQAVMSVSGQYYLGSLYGATGVVIGLILSFMCTAGWIIPRKFYLITRKQ